MRKVFITRKTTTFNGTASIILDGIAVAELNNGGIIELQIDDYPHEILVSCANGVGSAKQIYAGSTNIFFDTNLTEDSTFDLMYRITESSIYKPGKSAFKINKSHISATVIGVILLALSIFLYLFNFTSLISFLFGITFAVASSFVMIFGGFWIIVIPLPFIYVWKAGCIKEYRLKKYKIILGILSVMLPLLSIISLCINL